MERAVQHQPDSNDRIMAAYVRGPYSHNTIRRMVSFRDSEPTLFIFLFVLARTRGCINSLAPGEDTRTSPREAGTGNEWAVRSQAWHTFPRGVLQKQHFVIKQEKEKENVCASVPSEAAFVRGNSRCHFQGRHHLR